MNKTALTNVIAALDGSTSFRSTIFAHPDGTPADVLGHYAKRTDLQRAFTLRKRSQLPSLPYWQLVDAKTLIQLDTGHPWVCRHFDLPQAAAHALFRAGGCGGAKTAEQACQFIWNFMRSNGVYQPSWEARG